MNEQQLDVAAAERRDFLGTSLRLGIFSSASLSVVGATAGLSGCGGNATPVAEGYRYLRPQDVLLFTALAPVVLAPATQQPNFSELLDKLLLRVDGLGANLESPASKAIYQLFDLLNMRVTRWLTTGVSANWDEASEQDLKDFLEKWRGSSIALFNLGYRVLTKLLTAAYFSLPDSQVVSAYPGPPTWAVQAVAEA